MINKCQMMLEPLYSSDGRMDGVKKIDDILMEMPLAWAEAHLKYIYLPEDIIKEIISSLPIEDLMRYKSVSKMWYELCQNARVVKYELTFVVLERIEEEI